MDREEAKQLLELCRPGHPEDRRDPTLVEALSLLETDSDLKAWFDAQQADDERISSELRSLTVPEGLKDSILAGMRLHAVDKAKEASTDPSARTIPFPGASRPRSRWQEPWVGIAALFLVALVVLNLPENETSPSFTSAHAGVPPVIQFLANEIDALNPTKFDKRDPSVDKLRHFLASKQSPTPRSLPAKLEEIPTIGCVTFQFEGTPLSMICFKNGSVYHLITAEKANYPGELGENPQIFEIQNKAFKIWVEDDQVQILTIHGSQGDFPDFI